MAIGLQPILTRPSGHEQVCEQAIFDQGNAPGRDSLIIDVVMADQSSGSEALLGRIVKHREIGRQHRTIEAVHQAAGCRLLSRAVSHWGALSRKVRRQDPREHLSRCLADQKHGAGIVGIQDRSGAQCGQIRAELLDGIRKGLRRGQFVEAPRIHRQHAIELHAVGSLGRGANLKRDHQLRLQRPRAFIVDDIAMIQPRPHSDRRRLHPREASKDLRPFAKLVFHPRLVEFKGPSRRDRVGRSLLGKIRRLFFLDLVFYEGPLARERFHGLFVSGVGCQPERVAYRLVVIVDHRGGQHAGGRLAVSRNEFGVVEIVVAHTHLRIHNALLRPIGCGQRAECGHGRVLVFVDHDVLNEVRFVEVVQLQFFDRTFELIAHRSHDGLGLRILAESHRGRRP